MRYYLLLFEKWKYRFSLILLMLWCPSLQAEGLRSPEAVAQSFAQAYRNGQPDAIVALQFFANDNNGLAAVSRERQAWLSYMGQRAIRSYRIAPLLARDQALLIRRSASPQKKLVVVYGATQQERWEEVYLIAWQAGAYYLLPVHQEP